MWRGPERDDDISPITYPSRRLPSLDRSPYTASSRPAEHMVTQRIFPLPARIRALAGSFGLEEEAHLEIAAGHRTCTVFTESFMRRKSLPRGDFTLDASLARRVHMSGRDAVASQQSSPYLNWQRRTSSGNDNCRRAARRAGDVSRATDSDEKSAWVDRAA